MSKLRVDGETISPEKLYSGKRVIELLKVSFENGKAYGVLQEQESIKTAHDAGYKEGYLAASEDLKNLSTILKRIMETKEET